MICPGCGGNLKWDDGAYCSRCMFVHPKPAPSAEPEELTDADLAHVEALSHSSRFHHFEARAIQKLLQAHKRSVPAKGDLLETTVLTIGACRGRESVVTTIGILRQALSRAGLAIVKASEVPTAEERKVLEACAAFPTEQLTGDAYPSLANKQELADLGWRWAQAELARRLAKGGKT